MIKTSRMIIYLTPFICSRLKFYLLAIIGNYDSEPQLSLFFFAFTASFKCSNYLTLNTADRLVNYSATADKCDDTLDFNRWYRITGAAGTQLPEKQVPFRRCGARYPGWMEGVHPTVEDGVVSRNVCFVLGSTKCRWRLKIKVKNCGEFFVYKLAAPVYCDQRYCGYDGKGFRYIHLFWVSFFLMSFSLFFLLSSYKQIRVYEVFWFLSKEEKSITNTMNGGAGKMKCCIPLGTSLLLIR